MLQIGLLLILLGAGSFGLHQVGMEFKLLSWVDMWGIDTGNMIRIGAIVLGVILAFLGMRTKSAE